MNCLKDAVLNEEVFVVDIEHTALMKRRLMDLGFVPGTGVTPVLESQQGYACLSDQGL